MFNTQFIQEYLVLQGGILSAHLLACILVLGQILSERNAFGKERGEFCSLHLSRPNSNRGGGTKF